MAEYPKTGEHFDPSLVGPRVVKEVLAVSQDSL